MRYVPGAPVPHLMHPKIVGARKPRTIFGRFLERGLTSVAPALLMIVGLAGLLGTTLLMPGVEASTGSRGGARSPRWLGSQFMIPILAERGPTTGNGVLIRNMTEFVATFGNDVAYSSGSHQVREYFLEAGGAGQVRIARVVGAAATAGTLVVKDGGAAAGTTSLTLNAINKGAWSSDVTAQVEAGTVANTRTVTLRFRVGQPGERVEAYKNMATPATLVAAINDRSTLVTATDGLSVEVGPLALPRVLAATALSQGTDDRAAVDAAAMIAALGRFPAEFGPGAVAIPGWPLDDVGAALKTHADTFGRTPLLAGDETETAANIRTLATELVGTTGKFAGVFFGWISVSDGAGGTVNISPEGYIAGVRARVMEAEGPWRYPAGERAVAKGVSALVTDVDKDTGDTLNENHVNAIRLIDDAVQNYGWTSLSATEPFTTLQKQDTLNEIAWDVRRELGPNVFDGIDDRDVLVNLVIGKAEGLLQRRYGKGLFGLRDANGRLVDPGYVVEATPFPELKRVNVDVGVRIEEAAELIFVSITLAGPGDAF